MRGASGRLLPGLLAALAALATAGFLLGDHRTGSASGRPRIATGSGDLLEYPSSWLPVRSASPVPGLALRGSLALAPRGEAGRAGLLSGRQPAGAPGPLPGAFVSLLRGLPRTEVVNLANTQAYRYRSVHVIGYDRALELYVIPSSIEGPVTLACYAQGAASAFLTQCEQIVAQITLPSESLYTLSPSGAYSAQLAEVLGLLDRQRLTLREQLHAHDAPAEAASLASTLAERFAAAAAAIRTLEAPQAASSAQAALIGGLQDAHDAYRALAATVAGGERAQAAGARVADAEAEVDAALENYTLLGYGRV